MSIDLEELASKLTIHEASTLLAKVYQRTHSETNTDNRFGLYPIKDWDSFRRWKQLESSFWKADEIQFNEDKNDFDQFSEKEKTPLLNAFAFFATGDGEISSMLALRMIYSAPNLEGQAFYINQLANELVHAETYGKMIFTLVDDPKKRDDLLHGISDIKSVDKMNDMIEESFTRPQGLKELYVTLAAAEYMMFTPLFCIIFWYREYKPGKIKNVIFSNEQIAKDECMHCINGCQNYLALRKEERYGDDEVHQIIKRYVDVLEEFSHETLDGSLDELTPENVITYVKYVADDLCIRLGHKMMYHVENPFQWMSYTQLVPKTNFYEQTVGEYKKFNWEKSVEETKQLTEGKNNGGPRRKKKLF